MKKPRIRQDDAPGGLTHNPFAGLRAGAVGGPGRARPAAPDPGAAAVSRAASAPSPCARALVQREKKGRSGKTVTRIAGLGLAARELEALSRDLKRALGCGASIEGGDILLQGALTERAATWLEQHAGVRTTIGN